VLLRVEALAPLVLVHELAERGVVVRLVELGRVVRVVLGLQLGEVDGVDRVAGGLELARARVVGADKGGWGGGGRDWGHGRLGEWEV
jgi:hypothetical protein